MLRLDNEKRFNSQKLSHQKTIGTLRHRSHRSNNQYIRIDQKFRTRRSRFRYNSTRPITSRSSSINKNGYDKDHPQNDQSNQTIDISKKSTIDQPSNNYFDRYYQELEVIFDIQGAACYLTPVTAVVMEQEKTVEQEKQDVFIPYSNCTITQPIILGSPPYLTYQTSRPSSNREIRRTIFEYLIQLWQQTDALTIAKRKRELGQSIYQREKELLNLHEGKRPTQNRWNNKSPFKRQRPN